MKRNLTELTTTKYDALIIGGGIYGACIAWDAALRGLSVALVEKGDFGGATSANSLKIVHGGLRYLQDADPLLVRTMIRERRAFARIAPHLVHPLACLMPTYGYGMRSKPALAAALVLNDLIGFDRNRLDDPQKHLPHGTIVSRDECLNELPGLADKDVTGGAVWHDYQIYNSERMTLAFIRSAAQKGAHVTNYVEATDLLVEEARVQGIIARDVLTGEQFDVRASVVVNAAGAWTNAVLDRLNGRRPPRSVRLSTAMNIVTRRCISDTYAVGFPSTHRVERSDGTVVQESRLLFATPWREYTIIGTNHAPYDGTPADYQNTEAQICAFVDEINAAYPAANLTRDDVYFVHSGFLPAEENTDRLKLVRAARVHNHRQDGVAGLITVVGVKYTTARHTAEQTVDLICNHLGRDDIPCETAVTPLYSGNIGPFDTFVLQQMAAPSHVDADQVRHLVNTYGADCPRILAYVEEDPRLAQPLSETTDVLGAEVVHAVREEMAQTLADVVFRRTELGSAGYPGAAALDACATYMAQEAGWSVTRTERERESTDAIFRAKGSLIPNIGHHKPIPVTSTVSDRF